MFRRVKLLAQFNVAYQQKPQIYVSRLRRIELIDYSIKVYFVPQCFFFNAEQRKIVKMILSHGMDALR